jgi:hypothetical protein
MLHDNFECSFHLPSAANVTSRSTAISSLHDMPPSTSDLPRFGVEAGLGVSDIFVMCEELRNTRHRILQSIHTDLRHCCCRNVVVMNMLNMSAWLR